MPGKRGRQKSSYFFFAMMGSSLHRTTITLILTVGVVLYLFSPLAVFAKETASIENIKLANTRDDLITYFDVKQAFTDKTNQAVLNGVPVAFSFYITLYKIGRAHV